MTHIDWVQAELRTSTIYQQSSSGSRKKLLHSLRGPLRHLWMTPTPCCKDQSGEVVVTAYLFQSPAGRETQLLQATWPSEEVSICQRTAWWAAGVSAERLANMLAILLIRALPCRTQNQPMLPTPMAITITSTYCFQPGWGGHGCWKYSKTVYAHKIPLITMLNVEYGMV